MLCGAPRRVEAKTPGGDGHAVLSQVIGESEAPAGTAARFPERLDESLAVAVILKDGFQVIAAIHDMVDPGFPRTWEC